MEITGKPTTTAANPKTNAVQEMTMEPTSFIALAILTFSAVMEMFTQQIKTARVIPKSNAAVVRLIKIIQLNAPVMLLYSAVDKRMRKIKTVNAIKISNVVLVTLIRIIQSVNATLI